MHDACIYPNQFYGVDSIPHTLKHEKSMSSGLTNSDEPSYLRLACYIQRVIDVEVEFFVVTNTAIVSEVSRLI